MKIINRFIPVGMLGALLSGVSLNSHAAIDWVFSSGCVSGCGSAFNGNVREYSSAGDSVFASAWSNTGPSRTLQTQKLRQYNGSGLGVQNRGENNTSPNHATDNSGYIDSVLFDFDGKAVTLEQVRIGWMQNDADITLLAYTGVGAPNLGGGYSYSSLASNGWTHVGDYTDLTTGSNKDVSSVYTSSYWLISAFNPQVSSANISSGNDYFKIKSISGSMPQPPGSVPEPGSLLLLGLTLPLLAWSRRRARA